MRNVKRILLFSAFAILVVAPTASSASTVGSGVRGSVRRGPTQPVCQAEVSCSAPVANARVVFVRNGVAHGVRTDARGRYSIHLAAGRYAVRIAGVAKATYGPLSASVSRGRMSTLNVFIDTGIR
jgi:hypothetical protein